MLIEFYYGATPCCVEPTQIGDPEYPRRGRAECSIYRDQLERMIASKFGACPPGFRLLVKREQHDFGSYYEVQGRCHDDDLEASDIGFWLDGNTPEEWDEIALDEFEQLG